jgi:hypothetical protein
MLVVAVAVLLDLVMGVEAQLLVVMEVEVLVLKMLVLQQSQELMDLVVAAVAALIQVKMER